MTNDGLPNIKVTRIIRQHPFRTGKLPLNQKTRTKYENNKISFLESICGCRSCSRLRPTDEGTDDDNGYANIDWQYNFPLSNNFADKSSGWGMNFEGGYFLTDNFALGAFLNYHSNHEYFGRQTLPVGEGGSLNTDQQHTAFQLPFGLASRYVWNRGGAFQPYAGVKLGAEYAQLKSTFNVFEANKDTWGFYVSPEIGFNVYLGLMDRLAFRSLLQLRYEQR